MLRNTECCAHLPDGQGSILHENIRDLPWGDDQRPRPFNAVGAKDHMV